MKQNKITAEKSALMCIFREGLLAITLTCKLNDFFFLVRQINNDDDDDESCVGRAEFVRTNVTVYRYSF